MKITENSETVGTVSMASSITKRGVWKLSWQGI